MGGERKLQSQLTRLSGKTRMFFFFIFVKKGFSPRELQPLSVVTTETHRPTRIIEQAKSQHAPARSSVCSCHQRLCHHGLCLMYQGGHDYFCSLRGHREGRLNLRVLLAIFLSLEQKLRHRQMSSALVCAAFCRRGAALDEKLDDDPHICKSFLIYTKV